MTKNVRQKMSVEEQFEIMASVVIYTRQFCGYCTRAKKLLESKGVEFVEHDATYDPSLRQTMIEKSNGARTFPQIFINDVPVGGCDDLHALDHAGKLDEMLAA
ncbi:glutaredoxin 3 [Sinorhizobium fredii]